LTFVSGSGSQGSGLIDLSHKLTYNFGNIDVGSSATVNLTMLAITTGTAVNGASVFADEFDPNLRDNGSTISVGVHCVDLATSAGPLVFYCPSTPGSCKLSAQVTVTNTGDVPTPKSTMVFALSSDNTLSGDDIILKTAKLGPIKPDKPKTVKA